MAEKSLAEQFESLKRDFSDLADAHLKVRNELESIKTRQEKNNQSLHEEFASKKDITDIQEYISRILKENIFKTLDGHTTSLVSIKGSVAETQRQLNAHNSEFHAAKEFLESHADSIMDLNKDISDSKSEVLNYCNNTLSNALNIMGKDVQSKFDSLKKMIEDPVYFKEFRDEMNFQQQKIALDASNAVLRGANNDKHLTLVDKKILQILELLKKHELNQ
jgi:chromosome segregation ATPase